MPQVLAPCRATPSSKRKATALSVRLSAVARMEPRAEFTSDSLALALWARLAVEAYVRRSDDTERRRRAHTRPNIAAKPIMLGIALVFAVEQPQPPPATLPSCSSC